MLIFWGHPVNKLPAEASQHYIHIKGAQTHAAPWGLFTLTANVPAWLRQSVWSQELWSTDYLLINTDWIKCLTNYNVVMLWYIKISTNRFDVDILNCITSYPSSQYWFCFQYIVPPNFCSWGSIIHSESVIVSHDTSTEWKSLRISDLYTAQHKYQHHYSQLNIWPRRHQQSSGITRVGDTRGGNWHPSIFSLKTWRPFLVIIISASSAVSPRFIFS